MQLEREERTNIMIACGPNEYDKVETTTYFGRNLHTLWNTHTMLIMGDLNGRAGQKRS